MSEAFLEHANITVSNPARTSAMLEKIFGWKQRWGGPALDGGTTIPCGGTRSDLALYTGADGVHATARLDKGAPLNHVAIVVDDLDEIKRRVTALGLVPSIPENYDPGRRFYFFDHDHIEFEVVSYR